MLYMTSMNKLAVSENKLKLVLPLEVYEGEYTQERRQILLLFCNILDNYAKFKEIDYSKQTNIVINIEVKFIVIAVYLYIYLIL